MRDNSILVQGLKQWNIHLTEAQEKQFELYYDLLIEWNSFMNLTAITDYEEVLKKHFLDSVALFQTIAYKEPVTLLDMGTGAGFPGVPLKIIYPHLQVTLVDSLNKRINFLNEVIQKLELTNIVAIHGRAEELARKPEFREQFDFVVSRAVAKTVSLSELCLPYVKVNGYFAPYKSGNIQEELEEALYAIQVLGGSYERLFAFNVPYSDMERTIPLIKKVKSTSKAYPRAGGKPLKLPIIKK